MPAQRTHVSLVAIPDAVISTLGGIYDVLGSLQSVAAIDESLPEKSPLEVEIVMLGLGPLLGPRDLVGWWLAAGLTFYLVADATNARRTWRLAGLLDEARTATAPDPRTDPADPSRNP